MRYVEAPGGLPIFLTNMEYKCYDKMDEKVCKEDLNERDRDICRNLVTRGVLNRITEEGKTYFCKARGSIKHDS